MYMCLSDQMNLKFLLLTSFVDVIVCKIMMSVLLVEGW